MAEIRHLSNAPITEAVLDFRVRPRAEITDDIATAIAEELKERYPRQAKLDVEVSGEVVMQGDGESDQGPRRSVMVRYRLDSEDRHWVAQYRTEGMTVSMLHPYTQWEDLEGEATRLWRVFESRTNPVSLVRLSTRFINRLNLPTPLDFDDYLTKPVDVPLGLPRETSGFWGRITVHEDNLSTSITQAFVGRTKTHATVLLDIDTHLTVDDVPTPVPDAYLHAAFLQLRDLKNRSFFSSIRELTAKMYE